jgi:hypothetical protein
VATYFSLSKSFMSASLVLMLAAFIFWASVMIRTK